jgi:hypothetical protein
MQALWVWGALALVGVLVLVGAGPGLASGATHRTEPLDQVVLSSVGADYTVTSQGSVDASSFAASSQGQGAAGRALSELSHQVASYRRSWQSKGGTNEVQDLLVRFPTAASATAFVGAVRHSLDSAEIISEGPLAAVPRAQRTTYYSTSSDAGVGQAVTMQAGEYVDVLSFFSGTVGNLGPINAATVDRVAAAQWASMVTAPGAREAVTTAKPGTSGSGVVWAVIAVAVLTAAVLTPLVLRRRSGAEPERH